MNRISKSIVSIVCAVLFVSVLTLALQEHQGVPGQGKQGERPARTSQVTIQEGQTVITLDDATEARMGLKVATFQIAAHRQNIRGTAIVLSVQDLTELRRNYLTAESELEKAETALNVSQQEYERLDTLHRQDQNASTKAVQSAEAAWHTDEASVKAAKNALRLNELAARQGWGVAIAQWLVDGAPELNRILEQREVLLQVSLPQGSTANAPETALIQAAGGETQTAKLLSSFPRVDPRLQTASFLYLTPSRKDLVPGMTLVVLLPSGTAARGICIPGSAIVFWQGKAWAYARTGRGKFVRREISTEMPAEYGWFVPERFSPGDNIVVTGAQQLLSEEFRSQTRVIGEEDE